MTKKAKVVAEAVYKIDPELILIGLANSEIQNAAREVGLKSACEVFADRAYNDDGSLVSRFKYGAVFYDSETCLKQVKQIITNKSIQSVNGNTIEMCVDTICINGDNQEALDFVKTFHKFLTEKDIKLKSL